MRTGDLVTLKATVLAVGEDGSIRTHSMHSPGAVISTEVKLQPGDTALALTSNREVVVIAVDGDLVWARLKDSDGLNTTGNWVTFASHLLRLPG